jgi:hypothetical protein
VICRASLTPPPTNLEPLGSTYSTRISPGSERASLALCCSRRNVTVKTPWEKQGKQRQNNASCVLAQSQKSQSFDVMWCTTFRSQKLGDQYRMQPRIFVQRVDTAVRESADCLRVTAVCCGGQSREATKKSEGDAPRDEATARKTKSLPKFRWSPSSSKKRLGSPEGTAGVVVTHATLSSTSSMPG